MSAIVLRSLQTQPQQAIALAAAFAQWEWVFFGPFGARNFGTGGNGASFSGVAGGRSYGPPGVAYLVGQGSNGSAGLQLPTPTSVPANHSGVIVFTREVVGGNQGLFDTSAVSATTGFYVKVNILNAVGVDSRGSAAILSSSNTAQPGVNVIAWSHTPTTLTIALNGIVTSVSDATAYNWTAPLSFGSPSDTGNSEAATHRQYLSAFTSTKALSAQALAALSVNPWRMFQTPARRLWMASAAVQLLAPSSDISAGTWTASSGGSLFAMLNEAVANDATFDVTSQASTFKVGIAAGANPGVATGHIVRYRIIGSQTVSLMQGVTVIASWSQAPTVMTTFVQAVTSIQAATITDYTTLSLQFQAT